MKLVIEGRSVSAVLVNTLVGQTDPHSFVCLFPRIIGCSAMYYCVQCSCKITHRCQVGGRMRCKNAHRFCIVPLHCHTLPQHHISLRIDQKLKKSQKRKEKKNKIQEKYKKWKKVTVFPRR